MGEKKKPAKASRKKAIATIELTRRGLKVFVPLEHEARQRVGSDAVLGELIEPPIALTPGERVIMNMMREGLVNKEIAGRLDRSLRAVKFHVTNIYRKYGVAGRPDLLRIVGFKEKT